MPSNEVHGTYDHDKQHDIQYPTSLKGCSSDPGMTQLGKLRVGKQNFDDGNFSIAPLCHDIYNKVLQYMGIWIGVADTENGEDNRVKTGRAVYKWDSSFITGQISY